MALNRWPFDRLLSWLGSLALLVMFVPTGLYLTYHVSSWAEEHLRERGRSVARRVAGRIVQPMLAGDHQAVREALKRAAADPEVRYLCVEDKPGNVAAHTFRGGVPTELVRAWASAGDGELRFRTGKEPMLDVSTPLLPGRLGTLHVGVSCLRARQAANRLLWVMGAGLVVALAVVWGGARVVASRVSKPLRQLEMAASLFPHQTLGGADLEPPAPGTREVESLARGFRHMVRRLRALERDRAATQERMIHAERLTVLGELSAGLAHEIHNPLDGMLECLRYLETDPDMGERAAKYYPLLRDGLQRITRVMRQMLLFARSGEKVSPTPCEVGGMLADLELLVRTQTKGRRVRLDWRTGGDGACLCDRHALAQAGLNLILNAVEVAESSDDPRVRIRTASDGQWVFIFVEDSGPGVPKELRERIFEAFFTTKPVGKGTGLGLAVSRQLIRAGGGELDLAPGPSDLGGAKFVIRLPKISTDPEDEDPT